MKKKIAVFAVVIVAAAFVCAAFAGCSTPISDEEGVQAVINAVAASKAFYEEYDAETGYSYYIKLTGKNRQEGKKETNYLAYKKGNEDLGWNDFVMAQYKNEVSDSATSVSTVEYFGDVLADEKAEDVKENYVRAYLNKDYAVAALTDVAAVILTEGVPPDETVAELAESRGVNLLGSERDTLETGAALLSLLGA